MSNAQPLNNRTPIINPDGTPTDYFIRWAKQFSGNTLPVDGITAGDGISVTAGPTISLDAGLDGLTDVDVTTTPPTNNQKLGYNSTSGLWVPQTVSGGGGGGIYPINIPSNITVLQDFTQDPNLSAWTQVDATSGKITVAAGYHGAEFLALNPTSAALLGLVRPVADFGLTMAVGDAVCFYFTSLGETSVFHTIMPGFMSGATAGTGTQLLGNVCDWHSSNYAIACLSANIYTNWNTRSTYVGDVFVALKGPFWSRVVKTGATTYRQDYSKDGVWWIPINTMTSSVTMTHAGVAFGRINGAAGNGKSAVQVIGSMTGVT